ncbi:hypothetical protein ABT120_29585 [Nonomuraea angiospora]|uniref:hypothetical protein n=1 Tax=Nonomuraea angiospora TaxID=46172 RepID=UPI003334A14D
MTIVADIKTVGIVGGSLGGLFQAVALTELGLDVTVWERSAGRPDDRGAGIVLQPGVAWFLSMFCGVDPDRISVPVTHRQFFTRDGHSHHTLMRQRMISWGAIYTSLRDHLDVARYHDGQHVTALTSWSGRTRRPARRRRPQTPSPSSPPWGSSHPWTPPCRRGRRTGSPKAPLSTGTA